MRKKLLSVLVVLAMLVLVLSPSLAVSDITPPEFIGIEFDDSYATWVQGEKIYVILMASDDLSGIDGT